MERTNGQDDLIAQQSAKTKEKAATAKELTSWLELDVNVSRDSCMKCSLPMTYFKATACAIYSIYYQRLGQYTYCTVVV